MDDKRGFDGIIAMKPSKSEEELGPGRLNRFNSNFSKKITSRDSSIQSDSMICTRKKFIRQTSDLLQKTLDQQYNSNLTRSISSQQVASNSTRSIPNQQYHSNLTRSISSHQLVYEDPTFDGRPKTQHSIVYNGVDRPVNTHIESENLKYFDYKQVKSVPETRKHLVKQNDNVKINQLHNKKSNYKYSNTENSFKSLQPASSSSSLHKSSKNSKSPLVEFDATKLIDRMSKIVDTATSQVNSFLGSMHSPKKVTKNDDFQQNSSEDDHSLTDEDHPPFQDPPIEDPANNFKLDQNCHDEYPMNDDILIMFKEMEHYQKYMNNKHYNSEPLKMNRTTKKLNDYKDISPETPKSEFFQFSSTHKDKMLYETIVSQYTSIRCRYPSKIQVRQNSTKLKTNTGVLGFLNRYYNDINNKDSNDNNNQPWSKKSNKALPRNLEVSSNRSKNDLYLQSIWNKELEIFKDQDQDKESLSIKELTKTIVSS